MRPYLTAVEEVLTRGSRKSNRTGIDTLSAFNINYSIDLRDGFPLLTTKAINWKNIVIENLWFLSGRDDIGLLQKHGCKFWDAWANEEGKIPSAYGYFWRHFPNAPHRDNDQIKYIIDTLKTNPDSRRMAVTAWSPTNAQSSNLPPCHVFWVVNTQYNANDSRYLCLHLTQRSCDLALGVPYNIAGYALLLALLARFSGIEAGVLGHTLIDAHIYIAKSDGRLSEYDHRPGLREQLTRTPRPLPTLTIADDIQDLTDIERLLEADTETIMAKFILHDYNPHPAIDFKVAV